LKTIWRKLVFLSITAFFSIQSGAETLYYNVAGSGDYPPYSFTGRLARSDTPGILVEAVREVLKQAQFKGEQVILPPNRTNRMMQEGKNLHLDISSASWFDEPMSFGTLTAPLITYVDYLVTLPEHGFDYQRISDLEVSRQPVGLVLGYYYKGGDRLNGVYFSSEMVLLKVLQAERIPAVVINERILEFLQKRLELETKRHFIHSKGHLSLRVADSKAHLVPQLNKAIHQLRKKGYFQQLEKKYAAIEIADYR